MTTLFLLSILAQKVTFTPISAGNVVPIDSFQVIVPDGVLMADEDNVSVLYPLIGVTDVPNCAGIFFDSSEDWGYQVIIQHFPFQRFQMEDVDPSVFTTLFQQTHVLTNTPYVGDVDFFMPPVVNTAARTFSFGVHYFNTEAKKGYFAKKLWLSDQGAIMLSLNANEEAYLRNQERIEAIFQSVILNPNAEEIELKMEPISFLELLGVSKTENAPVAQTARNEVPTSVIVTSGALALLAGLLIFFALRMKKAAGS